MKYINLVQNSKSKQTTLNVPVEIANQLRDEGVELFNVKFEDGKLVYTPVKVVE